MFLQRPCFVAHWEYTPGLWSAREGCIDGRGNFDEKESNIMAQQHLN